MPYAPTHHRRRYPQSSFIIHHFKYRLSITITAIHIRIYISNFQYSCYLHSVIVIRTKHQKYHLPIVGAYAIRPVTVGSPI
ncbi:MAG: hypothetical protein QM654_17755 [Dysgonamonadaceae bacterium]